MAIKTDSLFSFKVKEDRFSNKIITAKVMADKNGNEFADANDGRGFYKIYEFVDAGTNKQDAYGSGPLVSVKKTAIYCDNGTLRLSYGNSGVKQKTILYKSTRGMIRGTMDTCSFINPNKSRRPKDDNNS